MMAMVMDSFDQYETKSNETSLSSLNIQNNQEIIKCDAMSFDFNGSKFKIEKAGTMAELLVTYTKQDGKKHPKIHAGILFSENTFTSNGEKHDFVLFHRMPLSFCMKSSNNKDDLIKELFIFCETSDVATVSLGKIMVPVSYLVDAINQSLKEPFSLPNNVGDKWQKS